MKGALKWHIVGEVIGEGEDGDPEVVVDVDVYVVNLTLEEKSVDAFEDKIKESKDEM